LGWRAAFYVVGIPGIVMALLALTIADPPRGATEDSAPSVPEPIGRTLRAFARNCAFTGTVFGYAAFTFALGGLAFWMPEYLARVREMDLARANFIVGSVTVLGGLAGTFLGGYLGDFLSGRMKHGQLWLCGLSSLVAIVPAWLALSLPTGYIGWLFIAEFLLFLSTGPVNVVIVNVVPISARAMAMAVSIFAIHLLGDAISPPIIGRLADSSGLARAVLIVPAVIALSALLWIATAVFTQDKAS